MRKSLFFFIFFMLSGSVYAEKDRLKKECNEGNQKACFLIQKKIYEEKKQLTKHSYNVLKQACEEGIKQSCIYLGNILLEKNDADSLKGAIVVFKFACSKYNEGCEKIPESTRKELLYNLKIKCESDDMDSCHTLGVDLLTSEKESDLENGLIYLKKACFSGYSDSCDKLKIYFSNDEKELIPVLNEKCALGSQKECDEVKKIEEQKNQEIGLWKQSCKKKDVEKCVLLANYLSKNNMSDSVEYEKEACKLGSAEFCEKICNDGNADFCYNLAKKYLLEKKYYEVGDYLQKACNYGDGFSCSNLLVLMSNETKVSNSIFLNQNELLEKACYFGDEISCRLLTLNSILYIVAGVGNKESNVKEDVQYKNIASKKTSMDKSIKEHLKRCKDNNFFSCTYIGTNYIEGIATQKNKPNATKYYVLACNSNEAVACLELSSLISVRKKQYLQKSCENGLSYSCAELDKIKFAENQTIEKKTLVVNCKILMNSIAKSKLLQGIANNKCSEYYYKTKATAQEKTLLSKECDNAMKKLEEFITQEYSEKHRNCSENLKLYIDKYGAYELTELLEENNLRSILKQ